MQPRASVRRAIGVALGLLLFCAVGASPAGAKSRFYGQTLFNHARNAISIQFQTGEQYDPQTDAAAFVVEPGKHKLNDGSKPFYVGVEVGGIGDNGAAADGGGGGGFYVEFIPPPGVTVLTNDPRYRPYWEETRPHHAPVRQPTVPLFGKGDYPGGTLVGLPKAASDGDSNVWRYESGKYRDEIFVPVQTTRKLTGVVKPTCPQIDTIPPYLLGPEVFGQLDWKTLLTRTTPMPCPRNKVGNDLQVAVHIADAGYPEELVPWVDIITSGPKTTSP